MLFVIYRTFVIRYGVSLFIFVILYSYAVFRYSQSAFVMRYLYYALFEVLFSNNTFLCCKEYRIECYYILRS